MSLSTASIFEHTNVEVQKKNSIIELFSLAEIWQQERAALPWVQITETIFLFPPPLHRSAQIALHRDNQQTLWDLDTIFSVYMNSLVYLIIYNDGRLYCTLKSWPLSVCDEILRTQDMIDMNYKYDLKTYVLLHFLSNLILVCPPQDTFSHSKVQID